MRELRVRRLPVVGKTDGLLGLLSLAWADLPLAPTPQAVQNMIAARDQSGKLLMTAQHFRFTGTAMALST